MFGQPYNSGPQEYQKYASVRGYTDGVPIVTALNGDLETILILSAAAAADFNAKNPPKLGVIENPELTFDGRAYSFARRDAQTGNIIFEPSKTTAVVGDIHEGSEHIHTFENEGGRVAEIIRVGEPPLKDGRYSVGEKTHSKGTVPQPGPLQDGDYTVPNGDVYSIRDSKIVDLIDSDTGKHLGAPVQGKEEHAIRFLTLAINAFRDTVKFTPVGKTQSDLITLRDGAYSVGENHVFVRDGHVIAVALGSRRISAEPDEALDAYFRLVLVHDPRVVFTASNSTRTVTGKNADGGVNWPIGGDGEERVEVGEFPLCG
jgi:hypothetical protein